MVSLTAQSVRRALPTWKVRLFVFLISTVVIVASESMVPVILPWLYSTRDIQHIFTTLPKCQNRVAPSQQVLFTPHVYLAQWNFSVADTGEYVSWLDEKKEENEALCRQGFSGNPNLYGLGIRLGFYLQWSALLLANHLLSRTPAKLVQTYLFVAYAMMAALLKISVQDSCNFSIEVMIVHYMLIGGFLVMYSRPNLCRAGSLKLSDIVSWTSLTQHIFLSLIVGHVAWFWLLGYNWHFMTMPYDTAYFMFGLVGDQYISRNRFFYQLTACGGFGIYLFKTVCVAVVFFRDAPKSRVGQALVSCNDYTPLSPSQADQMLEEVQGKVNLTNRWFPEKLYTFASPSPTQQQAQKSRTRVCGAVVNSLTGCGSFIFAITAIECSIRWNNISDVNSLYSAGQCIPLAVGLCTLVACLYELVKERAKPAIDIREHHHDLENVECKKDNAEPSLH